MQKHSLLFLGLITLYLNACDAQEVESAIQQAAASAATTGTTSTTPTSSTGDCAYTVSAFYSVGVNPYQDFVVHSAQASEIVTASTCEGISVDETKSINVPVITRYQDQIQIDDSLNLDYLTANNNLLSEPTDSNCDGVYRVTQQLTSGSIDTFNEQLKISMTITYANDGSCGTAPPAQNNPSNGGLGDSGSHSFGN